MGYIKPDYVVCQTNNYEEGIYEIDNFINSQPDDIKRLFKKFDNLVNGTIVYFMCWDGSKEGWNTSNELDEVREMFLKVIKKNLKYPDILHFRVGGDDEGKFEIYESYGEGDIEDYDYD
jgi:hypothetical protein